MSVREKGSVYEQPSIYNGGGGGGGGGGDTIKIGPHYYKYVLMPDGKKWLAQNLDFIFPTLIVDMNGTSSSEPRAYYYNRDQTTYTVFGGTKPTGLLYNQEAVQYLVDHPSVIAGCHVPTTSEWNALFSSIGTDAQADEALKAIDNTYGSWPSGWNGTDLYGFNALPSGRYDGTYGLQNSLFFRTVSGTYIELRGDVNRIDRFGGNEHYGYSVRLIVD